jgi:crotonobetainyl-CoA:carnitine CoA-transferase CaiB-like acyl-CoA transferase
MMVMCMKEKFWQRLCELIERPALARDPRYAAFADRLANRAALVAAEEGWCERFAVDTFRRWFAEHQAPGEPQALEPRLLAPAESAEVVPGRRPPRRSDRMG